MEDKVKSGLLLDVVVWEGAYIFKMLVKIRHCWSVGFLLCLGSWPWHYQWCLKTWPQLMTLVKLVKICILPWRRSQPLGLPLEYKPGFWISMGVSFPMGGFQIELSSYNISFFRQNLRNMGYTMIILVSLSWYLLLILLGTLNDLCTSLPPSSLTTTCCSWKVDVVVK